MKIKVAKTILWSLSLRGYSVWTLILANLLAIVIALWEGWHPVRVMAVYWAQSVIIGVFQFVRILRLKQFRLSNTGPAEKPLPPTLENKKKAAFAFAVFYGGFHLLYLLFMVLAFGLHRNISSGVVFLLLSIFGFFIHHLFSFFYNQKKDDQKKREILLLFESSILRILPIHLTIGFGAFFIGVTEDFPRELIPSSLEPFFWSVPAAMVLLLFMILKTVFDVIMHLWVHVDPYTWLAIADRIEPEDSKTAGELRHRAHMLLWEDQP